jgi:choline dehydrogenase-like flavoprotein
MPSASETISSMISARGDIVIVGSGPIDAVIARRCAGAGWHVTLAIRTADHVSGRH